MASLEEIMARNNKLDFVTPARQLAVKQRLQEQQANNRKSNPLLGFLPVAGSILGGIGGGIAGGFAGGVGAVPGAIGGGAAGGAIGEALRQRLDPNTQYNLKGVAGQAALGAGGEALGAAGGALRVAKATRLGEGAVDSFRAARAAEAEGQLGRGLKSLLSRGGGATVAETAAPAAEQAAAQTAKRSLGQRWSQEVRGLTPSAKIGSEELSTNEAGRLSKWVGERTSAKAPAKQVAEIETHANNTGQQISQIVKDIDRPLTKPELTTLKQNATAALTKPGTGLTGKEEAVVSELTGLARNKSLKDLVEFDRELESRINFSRSSASPDPKTEGMLKKIRGVVGKFINEQSPELKSANSEYSTAQRALKWMRNSSRQANQGASLPVKGLGKVAVGGSGAGQATQALKATVGGAAEGTRNLVTGMVKNPAVRALGAGLVKQGGIRTLAGALAPVNYKKETPGANPGDLVDLAVGGGANPAEAGAGAEGDQAQGQFGDIDLAQMVRDDISKTGGKNLDKIATLQKIMQTSQKGGELSASAQKQKDSLTTAMSSLDAAEQKLTTAGGAKGPILGHGATIPVVGQYLNEPGAAYHNTKIELATQLAKAITGGSRPAAQVIDYYMHSLPDVNDRPGYASAKIANIRTELETLARSMGFHDLTSGKADTGSSHNTTPEELLAALGY